MMKDRLEHTPTEGFDLVGIDDFELQGEQLYFIKHFTDATEANKALAEWKKSNTDDAIILPAS